MTMLKRILAVLTALVILAAAAGSAPAESAETVSPGGLTLRNIESLNGGPVSIHEDNNGRITFIGGTCTAGPVKSRPRDARSPCWSWAGMTAITIGRRSLPIRRECIIAERFPSILLPAIGKRFLFFAAADESRLP